MAHAGQEMRNPITHEHFTFLRTTNDTDGKSLVFDCRVTPGGVTLPAHIHSAQEERFEVLSGSLGVMLDDKKRILEAGDTIVLPAKIKHQWWNPGRQEVRFRVEVVPARKLEAVIEAVCGMAEAGALDKRAMPTNLFRLAQLGMLSETYVPGIPIWVQRILMAIGSGFGQMLGYDPKFTEYRGHDVSHIERIAG